MRKYKQVVQWDDGFVEQREVEYKDFQELQRAVKAECKKFFEIDAVQVFFEGKLVFQLEQ